ncbi:MAG: DUF6166 domain-containing protein [Sulfurimonas sp.]
MGIFKGLRTKKGVFVTYDDVPLELRLDLKNHSPMGFEWGYNGSGTKQLALAILAKLTSAESSIEHYEKFSKDFIEPIDSKEWELDDLLVREWLKCKDVVCNIPLLTPRFKLINNNNNYLMYLDNKKLGEHLEFSNVYNIDISPDHAIVYCNFSEISHLHLIDLPVSMIFEFVDPVGYNDKESKITENFTLYTISNLENEIEINFWFKLNLMDYIGKLNPIFIVNEFKLQIDSLENCKVTSNNIDDGFQFLDFSYYSQDIQSDLKTILDNATNIVINLYEKVSNNLQNHNSFEAVFNFPEQYQSVLKQYILYFEEFLNDLCIETDVNIRKEGLDTILSVEPKNKDEALEKISDALKVYLSAPILVKDISLEERLNMQMAVKKLYAECLHLESQLTLKALMLDEQNKKVELQTDIINETKRILVEAGVKEDVMTSNNTMLLNSLKSIKINNMGMKRATFINSIKASLKIPLLFEAKFQVGKDKYD